MSTIEDITDSLNILADLDLDLTQAIYAEFYVRCPEAEALMGYSDLHMRGRMLEQTFGLLMDPLLQGEEQYFRWEIGNHLSAYGVSKHMYADFLEAMRDCVKEALQGQWQPRHISAWQLRIQSLLDELALVS